MPTTSRQLPAKPHLDVPKRQARELLLKSREKDVSAIARMRRSHPLFRDVSDDLVTSKIKLSDAQLVIAREYGFSSWAQLKERINGNTAAALIDQGIRANDAEAVTALLKAYPNLMHVPVVSGNWGCPMSHAANLGRLEMVKTIAALGARDYQHAFGRALLQGRLEVASWLLHHGATLEPGIIMGACETLNAKGFAFLDDMGVDFSDDKGNSLAPLALVLETYSRNPPGKRELLHRFQRRGYKWPDNPIMAFHCGDVDKLNFHFRQDPQLINRRFSYREIYPVALGCAADFISGLHGTPIGGTTLLHLAIDFDELEIFDWLLKNGADVNAPALIDNDGFGGHTPLFNAVVSDAYVNGRQRDAYMAKTLVEKGALTGLRASLRKFLDWREQPGWHIAHNVSPKEWADNFPERGWVNKEALQLL